jgi:hypothetical protein
MRDPVTTTSGFGWRRLQVLAAMGAILSFAIPMIITLTFEPFLLAMAAPFVLGLLVTLKWKRAGAIVLGVVSVAVLAFSAPFLVDALRHPESMLDFLPLVLFALSTVAGAVAAWPSIRQGSAPDAPARPARTLALAAAVVLVAARHAPANTEDRVRRLVLPLKIGGTAPSAGLIRPG